MISKVVILGAILALSLGSSIVNSEALALTIYNGGQAMVKDTRRISFDKGQSKLSFTDVASTIMPQTVMFTPNNQTGNITILQQNFENNLASKYSILKNYINKMITVDIAQGNIVRTISAKLLSYQNALILQNLGGSISIYDLNEIVNSVKVPALPDGLLTMPTLVWNTFSINPVVTLCEVAYRASGISWKADYLMNLNGDEDRVDFSGWVTIDNNSGKKYTNTSIKLIAGDVNTVSSPVYYRGGMGASAMEMNMVSDAPSFSEKSFSDYHMYTLSRQVDVNEASKKQIEFIPKVYGVKVVKTYNADVSTGGYSSGEVKFKSTIVLTNSKDNKMGIPLPAGTVRVFKEDDADNSLEFIGESSIDHTPKNQNITVTTGTAFDLVGKIATLSRKDSGNGGYTAKVQLNITNHSQKPAPIILTLNNGYGDNNRISQDPAFPLWNKIYTNKYELRTTVDVEKTKIIQWTEEFKGYGI